MTTRPIDPQELQLLELQETRYRQQADEPFNWLLWLALLAAGAAVVWFDFLGRTWYYLVLTVILLKLGGMIYGHISRRKEAAARLEDIAFLKKLGYFEVQTIKSDRALHLQDQEDFGDIYILQTGPNQLFCWLDRDRSEAGLLPSTEFEIYTDSKVSDLLNRAVKITGERYRAMTLPGKNPQLMREMKGKHATFFAGDLDELLARWSLAAGKAA